jgi:uncharacterized protein YdaL
MRGSALTLLLGAAVLLTGCPDAPTLDPFENFDGSIPPRVGGACNLPAVATADLVDVLVLYDTEGEHGHMGQLNAQMLLNLLGHFPEVRGDARPTPDYEPGSALEADVVFYLGTSYGAAVPWELREDLLETHANIVWIGWNLWGLSTRASFREHFGFWHLSDHEGTGSGADATFYRTVRYNGFEFDKWAWWNEGTGRLEHDPYLSLLHIEEPSQVDVLATIVHSGTGDEQPYVVRSDNFFFVADLPFTYQHPHDRYLAFADLMHDFVGIDHPASRKALFRLEDVHPLSTAAGIEQIADVLAGRPFAMGIIPEFSDPLGVYNADEPWRLTPGEEKADAWRDAVNYAIDGGADLIQHGYTHQYLDDANPANGLTGVDYEFWDAVHEQPVPLDSYGFVDDRVARGRYLMSQQGWEPFAFEVPHYQGSLKTYLGLGEHFCTSYDQGAYWAWEMEGSDGVADFSDLWSGGPDAVDRRSSPLDILHAEYLSQFFPYVIHRDVYGRKVIPENIGNLGPEAYVPDPIDQQTVDQMLHTAELNTVGRCAFASFFFHPHLVVAEDIEGGTGEQALRRLLTGIEDLGYEFVRASEL